MSSNYPNSQDDGISLPDPTTTSPTTAPSHATLHANANSAIKAIEAKLGTGAATPVSGQILKANGTGTSTWTTLAESDIANLTTDLASKATDTTVVHLAGTETITGNKTFSGATTTIGGDLVLSQLGLSKWRTALEKAINGTATANLVLYGDSITFGYTDGTGTQANVSQYSTPARLNALFAQQFGVAGAGIAWLFTGTDYPDTRIVNTGATAANTGAFGLTGYTVAGTAQTFKYTPAVNGDQFVVYYLTGPTLGNFTAACASGTQTINSNAAAAGYGSFTMPANTTYGSDSITITGVASATATIVAIEFKAQTVSATTGVRVSSCAYDGRQASDLVSTTDISMQQAFDMVAPDLSIINFGANEYSLQTAVATFKTNMQTLINRAKQTGDCVIVATVPQQAAKAIPLSSYTQALYQLGASNNVQVIDLQKRWNSWTNSNSLGLYTNGIHPSYNGYYDIATAMFDAVTPFAAKQGLLTRTIKAPLVGETLINAQVTTPTVTNPTITGTSATAATFGVGAVTTDVFGVRVGTNQRFDVRQNSGSGLMEVMAVNDGVTGYVPMDINASALRLNPAATGSTITLPTNALNFGSAANSNQIQLYGSTYGLGIDGSDTVVFAATSTGVSFKDAGYGGTLAARIQVPSGNSYFKGSMGIGTTTPGYPLEVNGIARATTLNSNQLQFQNTTGDKVAFYGPLGSNNWGISQSTSAVQIHSDSVGGNVQFGYGYSGAFNQSAIITGNGMMKIGLGSPASTLDVAGSIATAFSAKTAAYTLTATDSVITVDATTAAFTVTLPDATTCIGREYTIKKIDSTANNVTLATTPTTQTIDGVTTKTISGQYTVVTLVSNGANWLVGNTTPASGGTGTVTSVSVTAANGLAGTVATATTTPAITLSTSVTGIVKGNGTGFVTAVAADFPVLNQNTTGTAANVTGTVAVANGGTGMTSLPANNILIGNGSGALLSTVAPNGGVVGTYDTQTLTNKRVTRRANSLAGGTSYTPNADTTDLALLGAPTAAFTVNNVTGTPTDGQDLLMRIISGATGYAPTWGTGYKSSGVATLPTAALPASKTVTLRFTYDATAAAFILLAADLAGY